MSECEKRWPRVSNTGKVGGGLLLGVAVALAVIGAETRGQDVKKPPAGSVDAGKKTGAKAGPLYGNQGGEKVLPADTREPNTVMRARREDSFFLIRNPRFGKEAGKEANGPKTLLLDYEVVARGKIGGGTLVLRDEDGIWGEAKLTTLANQGSGTIRLVGVQQIKGMFPPVPGGGGLPRRPQKNVDLPENFELYLVHGDDRYDPPLQFMVSNAAVMGKMTTTSRPRDWRADEIERYNRGPLAYKSPNEHPDVGVDVPRLPAPGGLQKFRYVDPNGRLLGLDYAVGSWENRKVVSALAPVYSDDQPQQHTARSIAREGYAVSGAEMNLDKYVCGIRLLFQRVKEDGTFDATDAYEGEWIGVPPGKGDPTKLVNDGRRVVGIHVQRVAIVDRFALVVTGKAKE
ncbi:hypothetical protein [Frigoriglobus tundricola]|uniref:Uncharacterized protein n=1 Tax=Frigoriglobus tundricola TaxID=2774151 RepID=A0A6M5YUS5_9BACT|nr:hypothetical protein [Frigoriglobus tundricola]QJW92510.1 hypothetical protein FTUN_0006 [Frigoriglobus tundricola]QJW94180.1 hypothetical protein FTUN_1699 [Frigoriglobus tundricola]QJW95216.1 hypothetical protein FTUN_2758 [Frigoriglobus tundricola]QJW97156.1 hypothetical protein FTUN_4721 [Frigoriglobus tundricola]